jgi:hypothetical protein
MQLVYRWARPFAFAVRDAEIAIIAATEAGNAAILESQFSGDLDRKNRREMPAGCRARTRIFRILTDTCIPICHVINAKTLAQHVHFEELPSGFDSGSRGVVVFFYNRAVVMETAL